VEARIHKVLDLRVNPNSGAGPVPLRRGISCIRVSKSGPILAAFVILSFHYARDLAQGLGGDRGEPRYADFPSNAARKEVRHASNEEMRAREEIERDRHATRRAAKRWGMEASLDLRPLARGKWKEGQLCLLCLPRVRLLSYTRKRFPCIQGLRSMPADRSAPG
jgi:hypothetical protein